MRTTVRLDPDLLRQAKRYALESGRTLTALIEEALRERLGRQAEPPAGAAPELPTFGAGGLRPGIDLDDSAGLLAAMEEGG